MVIRVPRKLSTPRITAIQNVITLGGVSFIAVLLLAKNNFTAFGGDSDFFIIQKLHIAGSA
jgi:hypothetical protein